MPAVAALHRWRAHPEAFATMGLEAPQSGPPALRRSLALRLDARWADSRAAVRRWRQRRSPDWRATDSPTLIRQVLRQIARFGSGAKPYCGQPTTCRTTAAWIEHRRWRSNQPAPPPTSGDVD